MAMQTRSTSRWGDVDWIDEEEEDLRSDSGE
jgi:hypothetical protein